MDTVMNSELTDIDKAMLEYVYASNRVAATVKARIHFLKGRMDYLRFSDGEEFYDDASELRRMEQIFVYEELK